MDQISNGCQGFALSIHLAILYPTFLTQQRNIIQRSETVEWNNSIVVQDCFFSLFQGGYQGIWKIHNATTQHCLTQCAEGRGKFNYCWVTDKLCHLSRCITNLIASTSKPCFLAVVKSVTEICSNHSSLHYQKFDVYTTAIVCT